MDVSEMKKRYEEMREKKKESTPALIEEVKRVMGNRKAMPLAEIANAIAKGDKKLRVNVYSKLRQMATKGQEFTLGLDENNRVVLIREK